MNTRLITVVLLVFSGCVATPSKPAEQPSPAAGPAAANTPDPSEAGLKDAIAALQASVDANAKAAQASADTLATIATALQANTTALEAQTAATGKLNAAVEGLTKATRERPVAAAPQPQPQPGGGPPQEPELGLDDLPEHIKMQVPNAVFSLKSAPIQGDPAKAKVAIIIYGDFECPFSKKVVPSLAQLQEKFGEELVLAFRHFPLGFHENAKPAARAAFAADRQGKFWEFHDKLFALEKLGPDSYEAVAKEIGLDLAQFKLDKDSDEAGYQLIIDRVMANSSGVTGTPTLMINAEPVIGALPFEQLSDAVQRNLDKVNNKMSDGLSLAQARGEVSEVNAIRIPAVAAKSDDVRALRNIEIEGLPSKGAKDPLVAIVEFSDFECPFCSKLGAPLDQALKDYPDEVRVVFRHNPLNFHENAHLAAQASLAAASQGKFWEYHDVLFQNQRALSRADLSTHAKTAGLDVALFDKELNAGTFKAAVDVDIAAAQKTGATGTPAMFVNGRLLEGAVPYPRIKELIEVSRSQANKMIGKGLAKREGFYKQLLTMIPKD